MMAVTKITEKNLVDLFASVAVLFAEKKDELCQMDANMGDGDLGLTMSKGYGTLPQLIEEQRVEGDLGKTLAKAGMKMSSVVPSTMGTLMSSGIITGGKAVAGKAEWKGGELAAFLCAFAAGIQKRGKCQTGDRTIYDALFPAGEEAKEAAEKGADMAGVITAALRGAEAGVEATKDMIPKYGKAAVFAAKAKGVPDQGAVAGKYVLEGLANYILGK